MRPCSLILAALIATAAASAGAQAAPPAAASNPGALDAPYDPGNPFARLVRGQPLAPVAKVYEDDHVLAFLSPHQSSPGHVLVISKVSRAKNILEIEPAELNRMMAVVQKVARAQVAVLGADGVQLRQNNGAAGGQTIFHMHIHVVPRYGATPLAQVTEASPMTPAVELEPIAAKLRAAMR